MNAQIAYVVGRGLTRVLQNDDGFPVSGWTRKPDVSGQTLSSNNSQLVTCNNTGLVTNQEIERQIRDYEREFGISSAEFLNRRKAGDFADSFEAMHWFVILRNR